MSWPAVLLAASLAVLVALHLRHRRRRVLRLSAARFFAGLRPPEDRGRRFRLSNPLRSRSFYPQVVTFLLLLAAVLPAVRACRPSEIEAVGLRVLVDTSLSMSTVQLEQSRLAWARREVGKGLARLDAEPPCLALSTFDLEVRELVAPGAGRPAFEAALAGLAPRSLGTDLTQVRRSILAELEPEDAAPGAGVPETAGDCPIDSVLVVTDRPAPDWVRIAERVVWRDVGRPVSNLGIESLEADRDPLGRVGRVTVAIKAFGEPSEVPRLRWTRPDGSAAEVPLEARSPGAWHGSFTPEQPGPHDLESSPPGAYGGDDRATLDVPDAEQIGVDWRLDDPAFVRRLGWRLDSQRPDLRVVPVGSEPGPGRVLIVGDHPPRAAGDRGGGEIVFLSEGDPLLDHLNLAVAETLGIEGRALPAGFEPVVAGAGGAWVGRRQDPRGAYVPGLPSLESTDAGRFSTTLFFNAVRWLMAGEPRPLFTLTHPRWPEPEGNRLTLHPGEGETGGVPESFGELDDLSPRTMTRPGPPAWPWILCLALAAFLLEQGLAMWGGERWL